MSHILVIDDDPVLRSALKLMLEGQGYQVTTVNDGIDGLQQARQLRPALIICDWMMPGLDGLEVCRQVRADPELSTTFFVLLTARSKIVDRVVGLESGADDFLTKPVDVPEMKARVRAAMRLHQLNQDLLAQKQRLEAELAEAADYVRSLLPGPLQEELKIDARFIPSLQLGGDCFDYYWLDPDYLVLYLLDVSGHGLGAALLSVSVLHSLRSQMLPDVNFYRPENVLKALNETFQMQDQHDKYFTIWYGVYNRRKRQLFYASAGHPPAVLVSPGSEQGAVQVNRLRTPNLPIGMLPDVNFTCQRCPIPPGSSLYIFSDGIYELIDPVRQSCWGLEPFIHLLSDQHQASLDSVLTQVKSHCQTETFNDDLSILRLEIP